MRQFSRADRLNQQILRDLSQVLEPELADQFPGMVTFTEVRLSKDLRHAKVFYSYLGKDEDRQRIADYIETHKGRIRSELGKGLRMRHIPEFTFKYDTTIEKGVRIEQLLNEIKDESSDD